MKHVFLCHNSADNLEVERIASTLKNHGIQIWFDKWEMVPGQKMRSQLEDAITNSSSVVVFVGREGCGPWQAEEIDVFLHEAVSRKLPVIPAILPTCRSEPDLPLFLRSYHWVDFRSNDPDPIDQIRKGIEDTSIYHNHEQKMDSLSICEKLYILLRIDQFPVGLWGTSLEASCSFYGHKEDPGSITVSTYSSLGISSFTGNVYHQAIESYRSYLTRRRSSDGAFGMMISRGAGKFEDHPILKHTRHTATAIWFWLHFDGLSHPYVQEGLQYLLNRENRTPLWIMG